MAPKKKRPWGKPWVTVLVLALMTLAAGVASWHVEPEAFPKALRLDEDLVFHSVFGVLVFLGIYVLAALATHTVATGAPLTKIGFFNFSFEDPAAEALTEGAASLEGMHKQLLALNDRTDSLVTISRDTQEALAALAERAGDEGVRMGAEERGRELERLAVTDDEVRRATSEAVTRFKSKVAEVERIYGEMGAGDGR